MLGRQPAAELHKSNTPLVSDGEKEVEEQLSVLWWLQRSIMVGHQFYTHSNGVPAQVIKHSPSATHISHLYNCWRRHSLPTRLLLRATFQPPLDVWRCEKMEGEGRRREVITTFHSLSHSQVFPALRLLHTFLFTVISWQASFLLTFFIPARSFSPSLTLLFTTHSLKERVYWHFSCKWRSRSVAE